MPKKNEEARVIVAKIATKTATTMDTFLFQCDLPGFAVASAVTA
jgi:hypothetical protein